MDSISKKQKRRARILALQTLYSFEKSEDITILSVFERVKAIPETNLESNDAREFAKTIVLDAVNNIETIDELLQKHLKNWDMVRLGAIDRNLLRIAVAELTISLKTPLKVVINEAVEIAKEYGTDDSGKFINGILDAIKQDIDYI